MGESSEVQGRRTTYFGAPNLRKGRSGTTSSSSTTVSFPHSPRVRDKQEKESALVQQNLPKTLFWPWKNKGKKSRETVRCCECRLGCLCFLRAVLRLSSLNYDATEREEISQDTWDVIAQVFRHSVILSTKTNYFRLQDERKQRFTLFEVI